MKLKDFIGTWTMHTPSRNGTFASLQRSSHERDRRKYCRGALAAEQAHGRYGTLAYLVRSGSGGAGGSTVVVHRTQNTPTFVTALSHPF